MDELKSENYVHRHSVLTHIEIWQMLHNPPFRVHMYMILIRKEACHIRTRHLLIYQQALCAAISRKCLDEQLLDTCLLHLLEGYPDLLCFSTACCIHLWAVIAAMIMKGKEEEQDLP